MDFLSMLRRGAAYPDGSDPNPEMLAKSAKVFPGGTESTNTTQPYSAEPLPRFGRNIRLPDNLPQTEAQPDLHGFEEHPNNTSSANAAKSSWKAPLTGALAAVAQLAGGGQDEEPVQPITPVQGIIGKPQGIPYQPIPYQTPILRRY